VKKIVYKVAAGAAVAAALTVIAAVPAQAATSITTGSVTCGGLPTREIHTLSTAKGDVVSEIYGGWQFGAAWPVTSSISPGYSSTYSSWDVHHWLFYKNESGGRAKGSTGVTSGSNVCI
jgi:hypothetical protein